ncbi:MAG: tRNA (N(6)-L-threonylcarbamoyladenosine(37)-C(2))-methylthiotransferase MtaB [Chloroflexi bacterium]|nr:tRNA (N(6)-L-threonylcarbamoyladenosine(37)-C(2))-methylthiotransferase MtaB [Chloroflexota bacterium]
MEAVEEGRRRLSVAFATLGCRLNQADSEELARSFLERGYSVIQEATRADVVVVNSCTVTREADRQSRQLVRHIVHHNPHTLMVLTGCYPSIDPVEAAAVEGVDLVITNQEKAQLVDRVSRILQERGQALLPVLDDLPEPPPGWFGRTRVQLKVEEGCNNRCSFCIVPMARGRQRSRSIAECVEKVQRFVDEGYQEVVLTGTHLGGYGRDLTVRGSDGRYHTLGLADLLEAILIRTTLPRLRLSSVEPQDFPRQRLDLWSDHRLCRHFHLPVQSGSNAILRRMRRGYTRERYVALTEMIRSQVPGAAIMTDAIVGFPGEQEHDFADTCRLIEEVAFARVHVFPYSVREGTEAAAMPDHVAPSIIRQRSTTIAQLGEEAARCFRDAHAGQEAMVLWEEEVQPGVWQGLTDNYLRVRALSPERLHNRISRVRLVAPAGWGFRGQVIAP